MAPKLARACLTAPASRNVNIASNARGGINSALDFLAESDGWLTPLERRAVLAGGLAVLAALAGCGSALQQRPTGFSAAPSIRPSAGTPAPSTAAPTPTSTLGPIPPPRPGPPILISHGPEGVKTLALTIDDGTSAEVVSRYVAFVLRTGFALTFFPNGGVRDNWEPHEQTLRPLIERGQVQIGNHTWSHTNLLRMTDAAMRADIERNEDWIQRTFGITSRPWLRPPYGSRNEHTDNVSAALGFTHVVNWNGTFGDSDVKTPAEILGAAQLYGTPGAIILGHANHAPVTGIFDQILATFAARGLTGVTLDQMFGTSRSAG